MKNCSVLLAIWQKIKRTSIVVGRWCWFRRSL